MKTKGNIIETKKILEKYGKDITDEIEAAELLRQINEKKIDGIGKITNTYLEILVDGLKYILTIDGKARYFKEWRHGDGSYIVADDAEHPIGGRNLNGANISASNLENLITENSPYRTILFNGKVYRFEADNLYDFAKAFLEKTMKEEVSDMALLKN